MKTKKPDAAARLADTYRDIIAAYYCSDSSERYARKLFMSRVRHAITREVRKERERMIQLAEAQRHYELVHHLTRAGAFALDDLIRTMKGPK